MTGHLTPSPFSSCKSNSIEQEQPQHLSVAARVRSLVKQLKLSSSSSAARSNAEQQGRDQSPLQKPQMKKQTRKRVPASRPYQDRLHNMAEARREIVTALRIHRASMRHQQQSSKFQQQQPAVQVMSSESMPPAVVMSYASSSSSSNHHLYSSPIANLTAGGGAPAGNYSPSSMLSYDPAPIAINEEEVHAAAAAIGGQLEQLACSLPVQPLGLDLTSSFQGFGGALDNNTMISDDPFCVSLIQPSSCPAASAYYSSSPVTTAAMVRHGGYSSADASSPAAALSQALDGEMFYSIGGERQGMELSETAGNVGASSAWWTKIFEGMESGGESAGAEAGTADGWPEWQWLCDGVEQEVAVAAGPKPDSLEMHVHDGDCHGGDHGGGDVALPCVVDVEGWDDGTEWFH